MKKLLGFSIFLVFVLIASLTAEAKVTLPAIFSDNMVLQQNTQVNVWGKAAPGEKVTVKASWLDKAVTAKAAANGKWTVKLKTPKAITNQSVTVSGENEITINNVLIGEVWLCTGQSNMEFPVARNPQVKWKTGMLNEAEEMKDADFPEIRLFHVEHQLAPDGEKEDCVGKWVVCNPENLKDFSAVGFVFGRKLYKELSTPVGLIQSTWGGTHAESWTSMKVMENNPLYADVLKQYSKERVSREKDKCKVPATLWNGMIAPMVGYTVKGDIWYQGESNVYNVSQYSNRLVAMVAEWRRKWGRNFPFYFTQIAPFDYATWNVPSEVGEHVGAYLRDEQRKSMDRIENSGMAVILDVGEVEQIHPVRKEKVGERLGLMALAEVYNMKGFEYKSPVFERMEVDDDKAVIYFKDLYYGLTSYGKPLHLFEIADESKVFHPAEAYVDEERDVVVVSSKYVRKPKAVRYAFKNYVEPELFSLSGLPVSSFRTDNW